jgi:integrase/recombinase XerD
MPTLLINDAALCADDLPWSSDEAQVAAVAFFARYSGRTLEAYRHDLRYYFQWATDQHLAVLDASRAHIEIYRSTMEQRGLAASQPRRSIGDARRCAATTASPTSTAVSRPTRPSTSGGPRSNRPNSTLWIAVSSAFLFAAEHYDRAHAALPVLPGLNGLRVSESCVTNIENLAFERGHRTPRIVGNGNKPVVIPLVPRAGRTIDLAIGEGHEGPIPLRRDGQRLDRRTAHRWVRSIGKRAGLGHVHPHMLSAAFIMAALDAGDPLRDVQLAACHAGPRTTTIYDRRRQNFDRHASYVAFAFVASG